MENRLFTKNFTLLAAGQASSLFGNCILDFALSMYVLEVTGSAAVFAGFLAAAMIPTILLAPLGGVLADRANRRNIMVMLDLLAGIVILAAALLVDKGNNLIIIGAALIIMSILGAFESPTVQACVPQMQRGDNIIRGNAVINQIAAVSALVGPFAGSMLYTVFGLKPVMYAGGFCFLITALFECFIRLEFSPMETKDNIFTIIKNDLADSICFIGKKEKVILKLLLLVTITAFFIQGTALVGLPHMIRNVLGLGANYYGAAESVLGFAGILGSVLAGLIVSRFRISRLNLLILCMGIFLFPAGLVFFIPAGISWRYAVTLAAFAMIQIAASIFSVFGLSVIQQLIPQNMTGKIMAFAASFTLCAQPLGQIIYGVLFDRLSGAVYLILVPTGIVICIIGICTKLFFKKVESRLEENQDTFLSEIRV